MDERKIMTASGEWFDVTIDDVRKVSGCAAQEGGYFFTLHNKGIDTDIAMSEEAFAAMTHIVNKLRSANNGGN